MSLIETMHLIRSDFRRMSALAGIPMSTFGILFMTISPPIVALGLYRLSHWLYCKHLRSPAWLLYTLNTYITGADITPATEIGERCYIGHAVGLILCGKVGRETSFFGGVIMGGGRGRGDIGGGDGLPVIGDGVFIGAGARVIGRIAIGNRAIIGTGSLVLHDVPAGMVAYGVPARVIKPVDDSLDFNAIAAEHNAEAA